MKIGVPKETFPGERRVALVPADLPRLKKLNLDILVERGAGTAAGHLDAEYETKGATLVDRAGAFGAEVVVQVRGHGTNQEQGDKDLGSLRSDQVVIGFLDPLGSPKAAEPLAKTGVRAFAMELMPRITRAQSMDALSSMANIAGYKAVLIAADALPKIFPMMMTAAGTIAAARVFVLGVGVAGLQAIATAKRLGAIVEAYDIRPEVKDQVVSVGGKFVELDLETSTAGDSGGYAKAQSEDFYKRQQELMAEYIRAADVIITTAAVPGRKAPRLVTKEQMKGMRPGSVIVDLAAETGGNVEVTEAGKTIDHEGVAVIGPVNVPSMVPTHSSQMYSRNIATFLGHLFDKEGQLTIDVEDEITAGTLVTRGGEVVHPRVKDALAPKAEAREDRP